MYRRFPFPLLSTDLLDAHARLLPSLRLDALVLEAGVVHGLWF